MSAVIATDHGPGGFYVGPDGVYVGNHRGGTLQRIDPSSNRIVSTLQVGGQFVVQPEAGANGVLWTCTNVDGVLHRIDLATAAVTASVPASCDGGSRLLVGDVLWAAPGPDTHDLLILNAKTGATDKTIPIDTSTWWGSPTMIGNRVVVPNGKGALSCSIDGRTCTVLHPDLAWLLPAGGKLYQLPSDGTLSEIDPNTLAPVRTYRVPAHEDVDISLAADDSGHLYYRPDVSTVYRINLATGAVDKLVDLPVALAVTGIVWAFGSLWVSNFTSDTVWRVNTAT